MNLTHKTITSFSGVVIVLAILFSGALLNGCANDACKDTGGEARVNCTGSCPSKANPKCYVRFREAGSEDKWENTGQPSMDRAPGMEFSCYCGA